MRRLLIGLKIYFYISVGLVKKLCNLGMCGNKLWYAQKVKSRDEADQQRIRVAGGRRYQMEREPLCHKETFHYLSTVTYKKNQIFFPVLGPGTPCKWFLLIPLKQEFTKWTLDAANLCTGKHTVQTPRERGFLFSFFKLFLTSWLSDLPARSGLLLCEVSQETLRGFSECLLDYEN